MSEQDIRQDSRSLNRILRDLQTKSPELAAELFRALILSSPANPFRTGASEWSTGKVDGGAARTSDGIAVDSKELVMQVFLDMAENYSVSGYAARAQESIGEIYLNLDKGAEYTRQSTAANAAIGRITSDEAFEVALRETRRVLAGTAGVDFVIEDVSNKVLGALCQYWFDVPDGNHVLYGGFGAGDPPPRCGRDVIFPSAYIFIPDINEATRAIASRVGPVFRQAVVDLIREWRAAGRAPNGSISKAIFDAFPSSEYDLVARTITGAIMGMVPTIHFNLVFTVTAWRSNTTFHALQQALHQQGGSVAFTRASRILRAPLMKAMQFNPMPDAVWRTAVKEHTLGTKDPVKVHPGDKIYVNIVNATRADLNNNIADDFAIFGGDRHAASHGTHACPGYNMAIGIMIGVINGLMEPT